MDINDISIHIHPWFMDIHGYSWISYDIMISHAYFSHISHVSLVAELANIMKKSGRNVDLLKHLPLSNVLSFKNLRSC
jgi:hypothetical protein